MHSRWGLAGLRLREYLVGVSRVLREYPVGVRVKEKISHTGVFCACTSYL